MEKQEIVDQLYEKLKNLSESVWERQHSLPNIKAWINQFSEADRISDDQQVQALYLLSNFTYFGQREIRTLLISLYRDLYRAPILREIRRNNSDTTDLGFLNSKFQEVLNKTRFLGIGNPSESGVHLLYYFRQENDLPKTSFINSHQIFRRDPVGASTSLALRHQDIEHYVFIDDLCGSGTQARDYSRDLIEPLRDLNPDVKIYYLVLFATEDGLKAVRALNGYDTVASVYELDASFKSLEPESRIFSQNDPNFDREKVKATCLEHGKNLWPSHPLGYKDGQLLIGFSHNTPDNTLPIFWCQDGVATAWRPMFKRYHKIYG